MTSVPVLEGGCLCGAVRFVAEGQPKTSAICHCRSCQKAVGAESVGWACFRSEGVIWRGESRRFFESSDGVERSFCNLCGTSLSYQSAGDTLDLPIATMDDPESIKPEREVYLGHRISWNARHQEIPGYQKFKSDEQDS